MTVANCCCVFLKKFTDIDAVLAQQEQLDSINNNDDDADDDNQDESVVDEETLTPFSNDLQFLELQFEIISTKIKLRIQELQDPSFNFDKRKPASILRELNGKLRALEGKAGC